MVNPIGWSSIARQVAVGVGAASFWRGSWYILDDNLYPTDPSKSAIASLILGSFGLGATQGSISYLVRKEASNIKLPRYYTPTARFVSLYMVASSCVLIWRGTWMLWDLGYQKWHDSATIEQEVSAASPGHLTRSGMLSHVFGTIGLLSFGRFSSVLAPPAQPSIMKYCRESFQATTWKEYSKAAKWFFK